jgi:hypothetical protein
MDPTMEMGSGYNVAATTAKFEIRRGSFVVSPQVNGSNWSYLCFCRKVGEEESWSLVWIFMW